MEVGACRDRDKSRVAVKLVQDSCCRGPEYIMDAPSTELVVNCRRLTYDPCMVWVPSGCPDGNGCSTPEVLGTGTGIIRYQGGHRICGYSHSAGEIGYRGQQKWP